MKLDEIRSSFLKFFESKGHAVLPSSPLIPHNDPSLMFTNSGMVQFKNYFLGNEEPKHKRATTSQKCVRAGGKHNDLDNVGYTARHHTFFEMLGNFSFGDYFKEEAIVFAWEFLTDILKIDKERLYVTVYHNDDYAFSTWKKLTGFHDSKIIRIATNDNFWSMGSTGPCGPCSEIFYDHGGKYEGGLPGSDNDGDRYVEIWNLVFMQNEQLEDGTIKNLSKQSIDTGIGLERLTAVMQGVNDNFSTDLFKNIINASQQISGNKDNLTAHKVIADHLRAMTFLIADGVMPSNEGRGYVLRRIMRRAMRYVHNIGYKKPFLCQLVSTLVSEMGSEYNEIRKAEPVIKSIIQSEEEKFGITLERGLKILNYEIQSVKNNTLAGEVAFKLYDTYGFPLDLTKDILRGHNLSVDEDSFNESMAEQKQRARSAWAGSGEKAQDKLWFELADQFGSTEFYGYTLNTMDSKVLAIVRNGEIVDSLEPGQSGVVILNQTPFYGESGGQAGDSGEFSGLATVENTIIYPGKVFGHHVQCTAKLVVGDFVKAQIDVDKRNKTRCNHSATHLLHKALRDLLGEHVTQKGSLVNDQKLRFDFSHNSALSKEQLIAIERSVNNMIRANQQVAARVMPYNNAIEHGAMALFGEKYGDEVRVIFMCDSIELCGGTHVDATGDICLFKIVSESAISSGVRRIEALTGEAAIDYYNAKADVISDLTSSLKCSDEQLSQKVSSLIDDKKLLTKKLNDMLIVQLAKNFEELELTLSSGQKVKALLQETPDIDINTIRSVVMSLKDYELAAFMSNGSLVLAVQKGLLDAKQLCKTICEKFGGKGGGSSEMVQVGGLPDAKVHDLIESL